jgi:hypothetical protein
MKTLLAALTALIVLAPPAANAAEPLGRLFFTPEQRAQLDSLRIRKVVATPTKDEPPPEFVTYNGIVRRSDGKATVWVNSKALSEADLRDQPAISGRISRDGQILLQAGNTGKMQLKVGQSAELLSGRVTESYTAAQTASPPAAKPRTESAPASTSATEKSGTATGSAQPERSGADAAPPASSQAPDMRR